MAGASVGPERFLMDAIYWTATLYFGTVISITSRSDLGRILIGGPGVNMANPSLRRVFS